MAPVGEGAKRRRTLNTRPVYVGILVMYGNGAAPGSARKAEAPAAATAAEKAKLGRDIQPDRRCLICPRGDRAGHPWSERGRCLGGGGGRVRPPRRGVRRHHGGY